MHICGFGLWSSASLVVVELDSVAQPPRQVRTNKFQEAKPGTSTESQGVCRLK